MVFWVLGLVFPQFEDRFVQDLVDDRIGAAAQGFFDIGSEG